MQPFLTAFLNYQGQTLYSCHLFFYLFKRQHSIKVPKYQSNICDFQNGSMIVTIYKYILLYYILLYIIIYNIRNGAPVNEK